VPEDPGRTDEELEPSLLRNDEIPARADTAVPEPRGDHQLAPEHMLPHFLADGIPSRAGAHDEEQ